MQRPQPLSPEEAKEKILLILREGDVKLTSHCRYQSMRDHNVFMDDISNALEVGEVSLDDWNEEFENWKYVVEGFDCENEELVLVAVIIETDMTIRVLTLW